jgi:hypothetical protein
MLHIMEVIVNLLYRIMVEGWVVFYTIAHNCIPADALPSDKVVFSWKWINASGEREFYQNCIDIK